MGINIISSSDFHIGCNRVAPESIPNHVRDILFPHLDDTLDVLFIVGDFYHSLLDLSGRAGYEAVCLINELIMLAVKHKFLIRVVQGTFSHDRNQNQFFNTNSESLVNDSGEDLVKVFYKVDIEKIKSLDISIMYVPDDLPHKNLMDVIRTRLSDANLDKADFILTHGYFEHLIPTGMPSTPPNTLNAKVMSDLVRAVVLNGHVHTPSVFLKVINNGSFDRIAHREEEPKGFFKVMYDKQSGTTEHEFVENTSAAIFKTFNLSGYLEDVDRALVYLNEQLTIVMGNIVNDEVPHVRVMSDSVHIRQAAIQYGGSNFPAILLEVGKHNKHINSEITSLHALKELPVITPDNLIDLIIDFTSIDGYGLSREFITGELDG